MNRRSFFKLGAGAAGIALIPSFVFAGVAAAVGDQLSRLTSEQLSHLNIAFPTKVEKPEGGVSVTFELKPIVARRFNEKIYVLFETERRLRVYDSTGFQVSSVSIDNEIGNVRDFCVTYDDLIYVVSGTLNQVVCISSDGQLVNIIGEFGWERSEQLNGPVSITMDANGMLHVLNSGTNTIKVFNNSGVFLYEYGKKRWGRRNRYAKLDGKQQIAVYEQSLSSAKWKFSLDGKQIYGL